MLVVLCHLFYELWDMPFITLVTILLFQIGTFQRCYIGLLYIQASYKRAYVSYTLTSEMSILNLYHAKII